jgi:HEPN domain-containing protein
MASIRVYYLRKCEDSDLNGIQKQTIYWLTSSRQDLQVANMLLKNRKTRHALFFYHLAMEKLMKALVCKTTRQPAPRIHSLPVLAARAGASLKPEQEQFLARFDRFNLAGRYPDDLTPMPRRPQAISLLAEFRTVYRCLAKQL